MQGYENKLVWANEVLKTLDNIQMELREQDPEHSLEKETDMRESMEGLLALTPGSTEEELQERIAAALRRQDLQLCRTHKVGFYAPGFNNREMDSDEFLREMQRDHAMVEKYFHRYRRCPDCGYLIQWDDEVEI